MSMIDSVGQKKFILLDHYLADTAAAEMALQDVEWELSSPVDDADITFTGKPLSTLFEDGRREELNKSLMSEGTDSQNEQCCKCRDCADQTVAKRSLCYITNRDDLAHLPLAERKYVEAVSDVLKNTLGDKLAGLYLLGSATSNAYQPGVSDINIAAVITNTFPESTYFDLTSKLSHSALRCPARKIEFVLYTQESARNPEIQPNSHFPFPYELNFNSGEGIKDYLGLANKGHGQSEHWFVLDIATGRYLGKTLYGTDVKETFAEPDWITVRRAISSGIWWYRRKLPQITRNGKFTLPPTVEEEKRTLMQY